MTDQEKLRQIFDLLAFTRDVLASQVPESAGQAVHKNFHIIAVEIEKILRGQFARNRHL